MFRTLPLHAGQPRAQVEITVDGQPLKAREGETLAIAMLAAGIVHFRRTPVSGQPRAPLCLMGVCFDCLVEVDGGPAVQSCMVPVRAGMRVRLPQGARSPGEAA